MLCNAYLCFYSLIEVWKGVIKAKSSNCVNNFDKAKATLHTQHKRDTTKRNDRRRQTEASARRVAAAERRTHESCGERAALREIESKSKRASEPNVSECVPVCVSESSGEGERMWESVYVCIGKCWGSKGGEYIVIARLANTLGNANQVYFVILSVFAH